MLHIFRGFGKNTTAGQPFDPKATPLRLVESVTVRHGGVVDAIEFTYTDQAGEKHKEKMGGNGGDASTVSPRSFGVNFSKHIYVFISYIFIYVLFSIINIYNFTHTYTRMHTYMLI